jgi:uncharacterized protein YjbI with pentapeptide repeats
LGKDVVNYKAEGKRQMAEGNKETTEPERQLLERYAQGERDFRGASLEGVNFNNAILVEALFDHASLQNADFTGADLSRASFFGS